MKNKRFKATLNWYGEKKVFWTEAKSNTQAKSFVLQKFSKEMGINPNTLRSYFNGRRDNFLIEEA